MPNSPPVDLRTINRNYPIPTGLNSLADDVLRMQSALSAIDSDMNSAATRLVAIRSVSSTYAVQPSDLDFLIDYVGASAGDTIQLPLVNSILRGFSLYVRNSANVSISVTTTAGATINGLPSFLLVPLGVVQFYCDGSTWKIMSLTQTSSGTLAQAGAVSAPSLSFSLDPSVGMYLPATGQGSLAASGVNAILWSSAGVLIGSAAGGFKGAGTINAQGILYNGQDLIARADGTATSPTYSFGSEPSLGVFRSGQGVLGVAVNGAPQFLFTGNGLQAAAATSVPGTQLAGSANFVDLYLQGVSLTSQIGFSANGVVLAGAQGGGGGSGTLNAQDLLLNGSSLRNFLAPNATVPAGVASIYSVSVDRTVAATNFLTVVVANYKSTSIKFYLSVDGTPSYSGDSGSGYARSTALGQFLPLSTTSLPADGTHTITVTNSLDSSTLTATVALLGGNIVSLSGAVSGSVLNLADVQIGGQSLTDAIAFGPQGVYLPGSSGGFKGAGTINVSGLYINGTSISASQLSPAGNALRFIRINSAGNGYDYRTNSQVLTDIGAQPTFGYTPLNKSGDTISYLTVTAALTVGAATTLNSTLNVTGTAGFAGISVSGAATLAGGLTVSGSTTLGALAASSATVSGAMTVGTTLTSNGASVLRTTLLVSGVTTLQSSLSVAGAATFNGNATFTDPVTLAGAKYGQTLASSPTDLSKHISLWSNTYGIGVTSGRMNYNSFASHVMLVNGVDKFSLTADGANVMAGLTVSGTASLGASTINGVLTVTSNVFLGGPVYPGNARGALVINTGALSTDPIVNIYTDGVNNVFVMDRDGSITLTGSNSNFGGLNLTSNGSLTINDTKVVGPRQTGWGTTTAGSKASFNHTNATLAQNNAATAAILTALRAHGLIG